MARQFSVMGNERHQELIIRLCERAVELDRAFAAPWATMAITQHDMYQRGALTRMALRPPTAMKLDPALPMRTPHWALRTTRRGSMSSACVRARRPAARSGLL